VPQAEQNSEPAASECPQWEQNAGATTGVAVAVAVGAAAAGAAGAAGAVGAAGAGAAGAGAALGVLTGNSSREHLAGQADAVLVSIRDLPGWLVRDGADHA